MAILTLIAIAVPSLGLLPWVGAFAFTTTPGHHHALTGEHDSAAGHSHEDGGAADLPGSPLHPADHACAACLMLADLSRCALPPSLATTVPAVASCPVRPRADVPSSADRHVALLPPARAPPPRHV